MVVWEKSLPIERVLAYPQRVAKYVKQTENERYASELLKTNAGFGSYDIVC
jgi:hypothetical protein